MVYEALSWVVRCLPSVMQASRCAACFGSFYRSCRDYKSFTSRTCVSYVLKALQYAHLPIHLTKTTHTTSVFVKCRAITVCSYVFWWPFLSLLPPTTCAATFTGSRLLADSCCQTLEHVTLSGPEVKGADLLGKERHKCMRLFSSFFFLSPCTNSKVRQQNR